MQIEEIKAAVDAARERQTYMTFPPDLLESDAALIALWDELQEAKQIFSRISIEDFQKIVAMIPDVLRKEPENATEI